MKPEANPARKRMVNVIEYALEAYVIRIFREHIVEATPFILDPAVREEVDTTYARIDVSVEYMATLTTQGQA